MDRKALEAKGLTPEQIDFVMSENGKDIGSEQNKAKKVETESIENAIKPLNIQIAELTKQNSELQETIKNSSGVDEESKKAIEELNKTHAAALKELTKKHESELGTLKREAETKEFFQNLGKKFITPETQKAFEQRMNEALGDKSYEGKNRSDILSILTQGADGKERTDIYAQTDTTKPPEVTGGTNPIPGDDSGRKPVPTII